MYRERNQGFTAKVYIGDSALNYLLPPLRHRRERVRRSREGVFEASLFSATCFASDTPSGYSPTASRQGRKLEHQILTCPAIHRTLISISQPSRTARIEARIAPAALDIVKRAAEMQGRSVSDFVVAAAQEAARKAVSEAQILTLSSLDQRAFARVLIDPPKANAALRRAAKAHKKLVKASA